MPVAPKMIELPTLLALLIFGHAMANYRLQGDFLANAKNRFARIADVPWVCGLGAHVVINPGFVGLATGSLLLALAELVIHALTDDAKCAGRLTFHQDQAIHLVREVAWVALIVAFGPLP